MQPPPFPPAEPAPAVPRVRWLPPEHGGAASLRPNVCNVSSAPGEITLLFGNAPAFQPGQEELGVPVGGTVVLTPVAAKLLGQLLGDVMRDYEATWGAADGGGAANAPNRLPAEASASPAVAAPVASAPRPPVAQELHPQQALLLALVNSLRVEYGFERSFKLLPGAVLGNRTLLGINTALLGSELVARVHGIAERIGMPAEFREEFRARFGEAAFVHFGFEEEPGGAIFKAYLEQGAPLAAAQAQAKRDRSEPVPLHTGWKWNVADPAQRAVARYGCFPGLGVAAMGERLAGVFPEPSAAPTLAAARALLELAGSAAPVEKLLYLEVTEDGNPRHSFDLNTYAAGLRVGDLAPVLAEVARHFALPAEAWSAAWEVARERTWGHVSGGVDRHGRDFLTIYYGVEGRGGA